MAADFEQSLLAEEKDRCPAFTGADHQLSPAYALPLDDDRVSRH